MGTLWRDSEGFQREFNRGPKKRLKEDREGRREEKGGERGRKGEKARSRELEGGF